MGHPLARVSLRKSCWIKCKHRGWSWIRVWFRVSVNLTEFNVLSRRSFEIWFDSFYLTFGVQMNIFFNILKSTLWLSYARLVFLFPSTWRPYTFGVQFTFTPLLYRAAPSRTLIRTIIYFFGSSSDVLWLLCLNSLWFTEFPGGQIALLVATVTTNSC